MADERKPIYFAVTGATSTFLKLNLDPDLYDVGTLSKVGGFNTVADDAKIIPINRKYAIASGLVREFKARCQRGSEPNVQTRSVPILVGAAAADTVGTGTGLVGETLKLGRGATPRTWTVVSVTS
jgi:hypothetical protein